LGQIRIILLDPDWDLHSEHADQDPVNPGLK
jgi:hypothetical protein